MHMSIQVPIHMHSSPNLQSGTLLIVVPFQTLEHKQSLQKTKDRQRQLGQVSVLHANGPCGVHHTPYLVTCKMFKSPQTFGSVGLYQQSSLLTRLGGTPLLPTLELLAKVQMWFCGTNS